MRDNELTDAQIAYLARENHIWINAFTCIRPSDEMLRDLGRMVIDKLNVSPVAGVCVGVEIGKVLYLRVNKS